MKRLSVLTPTLATMAFAAAASSFAVDIDPAHKFAWTEGVGWTNWYDSNGSLDGVSVEPTYLTGWIWAENVGWIKVGDGVPDDGVHYGNINGLDFGVNIDENKDLFGLDIVFGKVTQTSEPVCGEVLNLCGQ